tara:strand:+ start:2925 stop:3467 length:543 start_codon:yes stop_codon:yes gene_type:complete
MKLKNNKFIVFYVFNITLLLVLLFLAIPISKFLSRINLKDNDVVVSQSIVQPNAKSPVIIERSVEIKLLAEVDDFLEWEFISLEDSISIKLGENKVISYLGKNLSSKQITSTADFKVFPDSIYPYIIKTECFCFKEQTLLPGESKIFTMVFFLDPSLDSVEKFKDLKELVFTYQFSEYKS